MKRIAFGLFFIILISIQTNAQGIIDSIAIQTCGCVEKITNKGNTEEYHMKLGLCILEKANPYREQLKRDYKIDLNKGNTGKKFGEMVGMRMAIYCPETILKLAQKEEKPALNKKEEFFTIDGKIADIQSEQFLTLKIQTSDGKLYSVLWLYFFDNSTVLMKDKSELIGKKVKVNFVEQELYDARTKEYRKFKIIKELEIE